jgi:fatty-acyl-CoA synthase
MGTSKMIKEPSARKDDSALKAWTRALEITAPIARNPYATLPTLIDDLAEKFDGSTALISASETLTYRMLAERVNWHADWASRQGLALGETVCLLMNNCPAYMAIWLGITRVGAVVSLLNVNLVGEGLAQAIRVVSPRHVILGGGVSDMVAAILPQLKHGVQCWTLDGSGAIVPHLHRNSDLPKSSTFDRAVSQMPSIGDRALYIYTSGTTGLPKAASVSHFRLMQWSHWFAGMMAIDPDDRMYNCLPMYHSVGGIVATGAILVKGGSVVLRERFSASAFWDDIADFKCTLFQYIGELCRYLVNAPVHPKELSHGIRLCCGNGLRPDVWEDFQRRFQIPRILEFYAATEGSFSLYNWEGKPGAIGRIPPFLKHRFPVVLAKFDVDRGEPVRGSDGFCIACATNEIGEALGRIAEDGSDAGGRFEGYTDRAASDKKLLRNVFANGDAWFRTGDLMRRDADGFFYFIDRVGDTFRWKGENVSTAEVAETISRFAGVLEAVVYGVAIPAADGCAGMAAIVIRDGFDLGAFRSHLGEHLPNYAQPLFLRMLDGIEITGTFKFRKQDLISEGYDPARIADPLYVNVSSENGFVKLDNLLYQRIQSGEWRG